MIHGNWKTLVALAFGLTASQLAPVLAAETIGMESIAAETIAPTALNLTPIQQKKLSAVQSASRTRAEQLFGQIRQLRERLSGLYESYNFDPAEARRVNQELNRVQGQLLDLRLSEQQQLRGVLSPDQFAQLQAGVHRHGGPDDHGPHDHGPNDHGPNDHGGRGDGDHGRRR